MFVNIFYIPSPNGDRAKGPKHFHKKTLRTLFKKSLKVLACLIILKDITGHLKKSQKVWAVYKQHLLIYKYPYSKTHYESLFIFPKLSKHYIHFYGICLPFLDIFGDFLYVLRLDKSGYIGYNPGNYGFDKRKIV